MRYFLGFFKYSWYLLDGIRKVLHLLLLLVFFGLILVALSPQIPLVPRSAALLIAPQGQLVEQNSGGPLDRAIAEASGEQEFEVRVRDVVEAIERARDDERIKVLVMDLDGLTGGGIAKLEEVAEALREFRTSGKQVIAMGQSFDQQQYYLAAQADQIYLDPHGMVLIDGFAYYTQYFKEAIDKLGVSVNVFKAGKYKSAVEPFLRQDMSPEAREANQQWLDSLWRTYQAKVTEARGLDAGALTDYAEQLLPSLKAVEGDFAKLAVERRLVTELKTREQVIEQLKLQVGEDDDDHSYRRVHFQDYLAAEHAEHPLENRGSNKVGIVVAAGEIVDGERTAGTVGGDSLAELLRQARYDDDLKAVVLRIDSPGGSVMASEVIRREIAALKAAGKPVVASMSSTAASGGYYIAMDADEIWANPATITGSIGVFGIMPTFEGTLGKLGISTDGLGTTSIAGALRSDRAMSNTAREVFQLSVDHEYTQFVNKVAEARKQPYETIDAVAQGRVWAADDAVKQGLVDQLGLLQDAVQAAAARAQLGEDYQQEYLDVDLSWRQLLAQQVNALTARVTRMLVPDLQLLRGLQQQFTPLQRETLRLQRMADSRQLYYYCACTVE
ncbi:signal peptide peptidase SppA [Arenimonas sp.]|uniref:signal peptide peptidase SppA n=1 Tax=Arenimonas sp. TaxID=1872635 RepID=UPI0039E59C3A